MLDHARGRRACRLGLIAALGLTLTTGCAIRLEPPAHRPVSGDLAAASMGLVPRDAWFGSAGSSDFWSGSPRDEPALELDRPIDRLWPEPHAGRLPTPVQIWRPSPLALRLAGYSGDHARGDDDVGSGVAGPPLPARRPALLALQPAPRQPLAAPRRIWIPKPKPRAHGAS